MNMNEVKTYTHIYIYTNTHEQKCTHEYIYPKTHTTLKDLIYQASLQHCHVLRKITIFGKIMNIKTLPNYK